MSGARYLSLCAGIKRATRLSLPATYAVPRHHYRFGINQAGKWREILNTDSMHYHDSNAR